MQIPVHNTSGEVTKQIEISDAVFAVPFNQTVVNQAMLRQRANLRHGTADTKTRTEVAGSTRKLFKQKGTGNARAGSIKSPLRKGGGVIFGPHPRDYSQAMPKKMRQVALRTVLSAKVGGGEFTVVDQLAFEAPKTKEMANILNALKIDSSALIVTDAAVTNVVKSARNIPEVKTLPANQLNVLDLLSYKRVLMTEAAVRKAEELWGKNN